jgi:hypothetical protein
VCKRARELLSHLACLQVHAVQAEVHMCIATVHVCTQWNEGIELHAWWTRPGVDAWCVCVCTCVCVCVNSNAQSVGQSPRAWHRVRQTCQPSALHRPSPPVRGGTPLSTSGLPVAMCAFEVHGFAMHG